MTRIDHSGHNHPKTTAARTACRKAMKNTVDAPNWRLAIVGKGKAVHTAEIGQDDVLIGVRCGAGLGRGVRGNSPMRRLADGFISDVTCTKCRSFYGVAHN